MSERSGGEFINFKYPDLQKSDQVQKSVEKKQRIEGLKTPNHPIDRNEVFLDRLENIFENPNIEIKEENLGEEALKNLLDKKKQQTKDRNIELFKNKFLYPAVLIDKNNIPDSYFELQIKIARERGQAEDLGNIKTAKDIPIENKRQTGETLYNDQKKSLDMWIDYLASPDALYPSWFKYYTLRNITKMGNYNKETHEFNKRSKTSIGIFPDLNREALSYTYDTLSKHYLKGETVEGEELKKLLDSAKFDKIYAYAMDKVTPASKENKEKIEGSWTKFTQGDDHIPLYESLQGHGTGWCTAGEETAKSQLQGGDFYVYYSKDENGLNTIPRIAIRTNNGQVAEVRGIDKDQNLEAKMLDIAQEKYHQLPGGEKFDKKDHDMKYLTLIDQKIKDDNEELSKDDLIFLYEVEGKIEGFGHQKDPRIEEIKSKRDIMSDINQLTEEKHKIKVTKDLALSLSRLTGEDLDKSLDFICKKGDVESTNGVVSSLSFLSGENLNKAWNFIYKKGNNKTAYSLAQNLHNLPEKNQDKALDFINKKGTKNATKELILKLNDLSKENLDKAWGFIYKKGNDETAAALASNLRYFSGENLDKAWNFINKKGNKETATSLAEHLYSLSKDGENINKAWNFILRKGGEDTARSLAFNLNYLPEKNLDKAFDFINKKNKGRYSSSVSVISSLSGENLDKAWNFINEKGNEKEASGLTSFVAVLTGEKLEKAWDFILRKGGKDTARSFVHELHDLTGENLDKAWSFINERGNSESTDALVSNLASLALTGENLEKAWNFINERGNNETANWLAYNLKNLTGENLEKAWNFINERGNNVTAKRLIRYLPGLSGKNRDNVLDFIQRKSNKRIINKLTKVA